RGKHCGTIPLERCKRPRPWVWCEGRRHLASAIRETNRERKCSTDRFCLAPHAGGRTAPPTPFLGGSGYEQRQSPVEAQASSRLVDARIRHERDERLWFDNAILRSVTQRGASLLLRPKPSLHLTLPGDWTLSFRCFAT